MTERSAALNGWIQPFLGRWGVALIFAIALVLRAAVALWLPPEVVWKPDGDRYVLIANNLLSGRGFGSIIENRLSVLTLPLLIAGVDWVSGYNYTVLRLFGALLGASTCVLGWALTTRLFDRTTAFIAGLLLAIYPYYVYIAPVYEYPQTLFVFIMAVAFLLIYRFLRTNRKTWLFFAGICLGLGILTVPTTLLFVPLLGLSLWSSRIQETIIRVVVLFVALSIPVGSWVVRNYRAYDEVILVNQAAGLNFWVANNETYYRLGKAAVEPACGPGYEHTTFCKDWNVVGVEVGGGKYAPRELVKAHEAAGWRYGWKFVHESPGRFAILAVKKFLSFWSPGPGAVNGGGASRQCSSRLDCGTIVYTRSDSRPVRPRAFTQCVATLPSRVRLRSGFCSCLHCFSAHHALSTAARFLPDYFCRVHSQELDMAS
jgi:4-amino-4-deoxy-L-arabinose transferase-like glycosyltransferase